MMLLRYVLLLLCATVAGACESAAAQSCEALPGLANASADASAALQDCLRKAPAGGRLLLRPGIYRLEQPITIDRSVAISTAGMSETLPGCAALPAKRCATLLLAPAKASGAMPITVIADGVRLSHLVIRGSGQVPHLRQACQRPDLRPSGGLVRVSGSNFSLRRSTLRDATCYTGLEVINTARAPRIEGVRVGPNGDHRPGEIWSDGVTIHDTAGAIVRDNDFVDNSDVQLILGGCRDCRVENNRFRHGGARTGGAFAELMLHSFPNTSGDFSGTLVSANRIDCGAGRLCGYGIMIGAEPWYPGRMTGGRITGNSVRNAQVGLNVDALTGPVAIDGNRVESSGGLRVSDCGKRNWPAANIAPRSRRWIRGDPSSQSEGAVDTRRCILNR